MFTRVIHGNAGSNGDEIRAALDARHAGLRREAGYLGSTSGVSDDGTVFAVEVYSDAKAAKAAGDPEMTGLFSEPPQIVQCGTVETYMSDRDVANTGFVQIEVFRGVRDLEEFRAVAKGFDNLAHLRPDLLWVLCSFTDDGTVYAANHFTSEGDARAAEAGEPPAEVIELIQRWGAIMNGVDYIDLRAPHVDIERTN